MNKSKTRRHRHRRNKLSRRMKKRGGVPKVPKSIMNRNDKFKSIQNYWIHVIGDILKNYNPNEATAELRRLGHNGIWKNIHTNTGNNSDREMDDSDFFKQIRRSVAVGQEGMIFIRTSASSGQWQMTEDSTPAEIDEYYNYILWLSDQNRDHIFWVPKNYDMMKR